MHSAGTWRVFSFAFPAAVFPPTPTPEKIRGETPQGHGISRVVPIGAREK